MKSQFKNTPLALAVAALFVSPAVFASDNNTDNGSHYSDVKIDATAELNVDANANVNLNAVKSTRDVNNTKDVHTEGTVGVTGLIGIDSSSLATVDDRQINYQNDVSNNAVTNNASVNGNALNKASGNIGVNVTAGDNNQQANAAALASSDASFVFGSADAEITAVQHAEHNTTRNLGNTNAAGLGGDALANATGNIGVNISAGNSNQQKNDLSASVAVARMAQASVNVMQQNDHNNTTNDPIHHEEVQYVPVALTLSARGTYGGGGIGGYDGTQSGTYSGTHSGTSSGNSYQSSNFYPDTWSFDPALGSSSQHPCGNCVQTGHIDMDSQAQGAVQNPNKPGVGGLGFDNTGTYSGTQSGSYSGTQSGGLGFIEAGNTALSGTVSGLLPVVVAVNLNTTNTANLGGNALANASGNIGVNIAAGTNNQQYNGLAIAATQAHTGGGSGAGGFGE